MFLHPHTLPKGDKEVIFSRAANELVEMSCSSCDLVYRTVGAVSRQFAAAAANPSPKFGIFALHSV